jgi:hypothetical protein
MLRDLAFLAILGIGSRARERLCTLALHELPPLVGSYTSTRLYIGPLLLPEHLLLEVSGDFTPLLEVLLNLHTASVNPIWRMVADITSSFPWRTRAK